LTRGSAHSSNSSHGSTLPAAVDVAPVGAGDSLLPIVIGVLGLGAVALGLVVVQQRRLRSSIYSGNGAERPTGRFSGAAAEVKRAVDRALSRWRGGRWG
jgi:hypothetical protein